jgi:hypothetical protein
VLIALYAICACAASATRVIVKGEFLAVHAFLILGVIVLSCFSGRMVHSINVEVKKDMQPLRAIVRTLRRFIDEHQHEPGFSFAFDSCVYTDTEYCHAVPLPVILFKRYLDNHNPRYLVAFEMGVMVPHRYEARTQVFPDLVKVGTYWNYYWFDGRYYALPVDDGFYSPDREDYASMIKDRTLEGAELQVARILAGKQHESRSVTLSSAGR